MHFENAADILVRLTKDEYNGRTGIGLKVTKANDFRKPPMEVTALTFDVKGLLRVENSSAREFPGLLEGETDSLPKRIYQILNVPTTEEDLAEYLGEDIITIRKNLLKGKDRIFTKKGDKWAKTHQT